VEHLSSRRVVGQLGVGQSLVDAGDGAAIHFVVQPLAAVDPDDSGFSP
jgi:hypothetical protein